ncbi:MAG: GEVED domain-containing protein, partial [Bacteroidota bacterium]
MRNIYLSKNRIRQFILSVMLLFSMATVNKISAQVISTDPAPYCTVNSAYAACGSTDYVNTVIFNTLSNINSGCNQAVQPNYSLFAQTTSVTPGQTYTLTVQGSPTKPDGIGVWIDWNRNLDFMDAGDFIYATPGAYGTLGTGTIYTMNVTVPANAVPGITRMRVRGNWQNYFGAAPGGPFIQSYACGTPPSDWNETEDYNITILGGGPSIPPIAGFVYNILTDTVWINCPNIFTNTSNNATNSYWDVLSYSSSINGSYTPYSAVRKCTPQWPGICYIDTTNRNFRWTFPLRGYYKVKLKVTNSFLVGSSLVTGMDSITKIVYVDTPSVKPTASFFSDRRTVGFTDQLNYYDLSLNGPTQWSWWLNPGYIGASTFAGAGLPNSWSPGSTIQNPQLNALDGGNFDVCLMVSNLRGSDTLCKHNYLTVNNGYMMC